MRAAPEDPIHLKRTQILVIRNLTQSPNKSDRLHVRPIPLPVTISTMDFLSFRPWISLAQVCSSERINSDTFRLTRNLFFCSSRLVTLAATVWPIAKTVDVSATNCSDIAYDEIEIRHQFYSAVQNALCFFNSEKIDIQL